MRVTALVVLVGAGCGTGSGVRLPEGPYLHLESRLTSEPTGIEQSSTSTTDTGGSCSHIASAGNGPVSAAGRSFVVAVHPAPGSNLSTIVYADVTIVDYDGPASYTGSAVRVPDVLVVEGQGASARQEHFRGDGDSVVTVQPDGSGTARLDRLQPSGTQATSLTVSWTCSLR
jgi:hypothetical protein